VVPYLSATNLMLTYKQDLTGNTENCVSPIQRMFNLAVKTKDTLGQMKLLTQCGEYRLVLGLIAKEQVDINIKITRMDELAELVYSTLNKTDLVKHVTIKNDKCATLSTIADASIEYLFNLESDKIVFGMDDDHYKVLMSKLVLLCGYAFRRVDLSIVREYFYYFNEKCKHLRIDSWMEESPLFVKMYYKKHKNDIIWTEKEVKRFPFREGKGLYPHEVLLVKVGSRDRKAERTNDLVDYNAYPRAVIIKNHYDHTVLLGYTVEFSEKMAIVPRVKPEPIPEYSKIIYSQSQPLSVVGDLIRDVYGPQIQKEKETKKEIKQQIERSKLERERSFSKQREKKEKEVEDIRLKRLAKTISKNEYEKLRVQNTEDLKREKEERVEESRQREAVIDSNKRDYEEFLDKLPVKN